MQCKVKGFEIKLPDRFELDSSILEDAANICERIVKLMIEKQISHTVDLIGKSIFVMPCRPDNPNRSEYVQRGWIEVTGVSKCSTQEAYDASPSGETIQKLFLRDISLDEARFEELKSDMVATLKSLEAESAENLLSELALIKRSSSSMM